MSLLLFSAAFLSWFRSTRLAELIAETPDFFAQNKKAVVLNLLEKEKNLGEVHQRLWAEIDKRRFDWTHNEKVTQVVEKVTLESFFAFWDRPRSTSTGSTTKPISAARD